MRQYASPLAGLPEIILRKQEMSAAAKQREIDNQYRDQALAAQLRENGLNRAHQTSERLGGQGFTAQQQGNLFSQQDSILEAEQTFTEKRDKAKVAADIEAAKAEQTFTGQQNQANRNNTILTTLLNKVGSGSGSGSGS